MKQKILNLTPEELIRTLQGKPTQQLSIPPDMELIDIKYDAFTKQVTAVVRSDNFENVSEGTPNPEFTNKPSLTPQPQANPSDEILKTSTPIQTNPATPQKCFQTLTTNQLYSANSTSSIGTGVKTLEPKLETNIDTCGFEDEFTKEQRKVLKFTSDSDFVIVKPTQFLKTEWEDINDTVKSIGGKWVKSGTIDYWAIPKNLKRDE
ncbi:MAG: hypothetical protein LBC12_01125 [Nitrososphaerota archaeon]|jgi:hypothetical protein|nr:hypothetical protein [Nitrososphaerota archaeon]